MNSDLLFTTVTREIWMLTYGGDDPEVFDPTDMCLDPVVGMILSGDGMTVTPVTVERDGLYPAGAEGTFSLIPGPLKAPTEYRDACRVLAVRNASRRRGKAA